MKTRIERRMKTRSVVIDGETTGCCDYPKIGELKTVWFRDKNGNPVSKTGFVTKIIEEN